MIYGNYLAMIRGIVEPMGILKQLQDAANILDFFQNPKQKLSKDPYYEECLGEIRLYFLNLCQRQGLEPPVELMGEKIASKFPFSPKPRPYDPGRTARVLIVDDGLEELVRTASSFIGWPNLEFRFLYHRPARSMGESTAKVLHDIVFEYPDIVLMDQGLGDLAGYEIVRLLRQVGCAMIFVANTDSDDESRMLEVGCLPNCRKGDFPEAMRFALRLFARQN